MATKTNKGLVEYCRKAYEEHWVCWPGTTGQQCTQPLLDRCRDRFPAFFDERRLEACQDHIEEKRFSADGANLIKGYMWYEESYGGQIYSVKRCPDLTSDELAKFAHAKDMDTYPGTPGVVLWQPGRLGVVCGKGDVIEARSFEQGVVCRKKYNAGWKKWFYMPGVEYPEDIKPEVVRDRATQKKCPYAQPKTMIFFGDTGNRVRWVQWHLDKLGLLTGTIDGRFTSKLYLDMRKFQNMMGVGMWGNVQKTDIPLLVQAVKDMEGDNGTDG